MLGKQRTIPYGRQWVTDDDIREVVSVLKSDWLTQGSKVSEFEDALAKSCGAKYAVAVSSGTAALHLACLSLGLPEGAGAVTSPNTFLASANCALYCGLRPYFADIEGATLNIDPCEVESLLKKHAARRGIKAIIPVHFAGHPCDMEAISGLARRYGLRVIEDACHALGAGIEGRSGAFRRTGSCSHSDMAVLSFHPVKHITTGEGGAVLTNSAKLYKSLTRLRNHGIDKGKARVKGPWYYEMVALGYNYRLTDIQCALGLSQLGKLDSFVKKRREIAARYEESFKGLEYVKTPVERKGCTSSYHLYTLRVDFKGLKKDRKQIMRELMEKGVRTQVHYIPVHLQPYYRKAFGYKKGDFPVAEGYYEQTLSIPMFPKMTARDVGQVISAVRETLG